jgi:hypothetical protein
VCEGAGGSIRASATHRISRAQAAEVSAAPRYGRTPVDDRAPDRPTRTAINRLRGLQDATYRCASETSVSFYDVDGQTVTIVTMLHERETATFHRKE